MTIDTEVKQIDRRQIDINPNSFSFILQIAHKNYLSYNSFQTANVLYVLNDSVYKFLTRNSEQEYIVIGSYLFFSRFEEGTMDIFPFGLFLFFNVFCFGDIFRVAIMLHSRIISDGYILKFIVVIVTEGIWGQIQNSYLAYCTNRNVFECNAQLKHLAIILDLDHFDTLDNYLWNFQGIQVHDQCRWIHLSKALDILHH